MKTKELKVFKTHIAQVRDENADQLNEVCELLGWTHEQYCEHQFLEYQLFVQELAKEWPAVCRQIEYSAVFRGFWNNEWAARVELDFLPFAYEIKFDRWAMTHEYHHINDFMILLNDDAFMLRFEQVRELI
ncbi:hypothetical protein AB6735_18555 [Mucilaginibacter sp. RCC_168]|uniref:hypothetical protein n=1 Tax=Mucilaginibacter sp. RCC_168 TaxID=3239221 RepID=UPI003524EF53